MRAYFFVGTLRSHPASHAVNETTSCNRVQTRPNFIHAELSKHNAFETARFDADNVGHNGAIAAIPIIVCELRIMYEMTRTLDHGCRRRRYLCPLMNRNKTTSSSSTGGQWDKMAFVRRP